MVRTKLQEPPTSVLSDKFILYRDRSVGFDLDQTKHVRASFDYTGMGDVKKVRVLISIHAEMTTARVDVFDPWAVRWNPLHALSGRELKSVDLVHVRKEDFMGREYPQIAEDEQQLLEYVEWLFKEKEKV